MVDLPEALRKDKLDAIVVTSTFLSRLLEKENIYCWKKIVSAPEAVYIPYGHPLFQKEIYSFDAFKDCGWIVYDPDYFSEAYEKLRMLTDRYNFRPKIVMTTTSTQSMYDNVRLGKGICLANSLFNCELESDSVRKYVLKNEAEKSLLIVCKRENKNPYLGELFKALAL